MAGRKERTAMKDKRKKGTGIPVKTAVLFGLAIGCLGFSAVGSTRAALTYYSETYSAQIDVQSIGVTLVENGQDISYRDYTHGGGQWNEVSGKLLSTAIPEGEEWQLGRTYPARISVRNSGTIDEYVRIKLYKYWVDEGDGKLTGLSPSMIDLHLTGGHWIIDEDATTARIREDDGRDGERIVAYYDSILAPGESTELFADTITIDGSIANKVTEVTEKDAGGRTTVITTYDYNGATFMLEAEVDAVQTHNAASAVRSAWGVEVTVDEDGVLRLE